MDLLPAYRGFTHSSSGCLPASTNLVSKGYSISGVLSKSNGWGQRFITRMSEGF